LANPPLMCIREGAIKVKWRNSADNTCASYAGKLHLRQFCAFCSHETA
jgi:hypothetical protein